MPYPAIKGNTITLPTLKAASGMLQTTLAQSANTVLNNLFQITSSPQESASIRQILLETIAALNSILVVASAHPAPKDYYLTPILASVKIARSKAAFSRTVKAVLSAHQVIYKSFRLRHRRKSLRQKSRRMHRIRSESCLPFLQFHILILSRFMHSCCTNKPHQ